MYELVIQKSTQEVFRYKVKQDHISIGRSSQNDICLADPQISRTHLIISKREAQLVVTDKSTNGSFLNGEKILTQYFKVNDTLKLGQWTILLQEAQEKPEADDEEDHTQIIQAVPTQILSFKPSKNKLIYQDVELKDLESGTVYPILKDIFSIGSAEGNDLIIDSSYVSSFHCKIEHIDGTFFLKDLGSTNGTFIDDNLVMESELPIRSVLRFGKQQFQFINNSREETIHPSTENVFEGMISKNASMQKNFSLVDKISHSQMAVLIHGPTGTGKELMAKAIHKRSARSKAPYITLNCGAIPKDLIESELFGHERGAFTSALQLRKGVFEQANGGTLFLDEIGELPIDLQPKLLRAIEYGEIRRLGSNQTICVDVRIVAATHRDLVEEISAGRFREDLYYRLYMIPISIPALSERKEDIMPLVEHFLAEQSSQSGSHFRLDDTAVPLLQNHDWPGNIRELKNVLGRAVLQCSNGIIRADDILFSPLGSAAKTAFEHNLQHQIPPQPQTLRDVERVKILSELKRNNWNKKLTAQVLGIAKSTLHEKIKKYGLDHEESEEILGAFPNE